MSDWNDAIEAAAGVADKIAGPYSVNNKLSAGIEMAALGIAAAIRKLKRPTDQEGGSIADLRENGVDEIIKPYLKQVNGTPELLSLLYDIDLLPEQITKRVNAIRMAGFCEVYNKYAEYAPAPSHIEGDKR